MAYFAVIVVFAQRYEKTAGVGTIVSLMIPYSVVLLLAWTVFLVVWFVLGHPPRAGVACPPDMTATMSDIGIAFAILLAVVVAFISNRIPVGLVAIGAALALYFTGVLDLTQALAGFGDPAVIFIATLFVVSEGLDAIRRHDLGRPAPHRPGGRQQDTAAGPDDAARRGA